MRPSDLKGRLRRLPVLAGPLPIFDPDRAPDDPIDLFADWLDRAIDQNVPEPHAMTLSTVDAEGRPDARVLILKDLDDQGWHFAAQEGSAKGRQLAAAPDVALTFHWQPLGRQVRVRGHAARLGPVAAAADFLARPAGSRAGALVGRQGDVLESEGDLASALADAQARLDAEPSLVAPGWVLYLVQSAEVEFWQGDRQRRHVRLRYRRPAPDGSWIRERLWP